MIKEFIIYLIIGFIIIALLMLGLRQFDLLTDIIRPIIEVQVIDIRISITLYICLFIILASLSLPVANILCLIAGYAYGPWLGGTIGVLSISIGSLFFIVIMRIGILMHLKKQVTKTARRFAAENNLNDFSLLFGIRLLPMLPVLFINMVAAMTRPHPFKFWAATALGIAPSCFLLSHFGSNIENLTITLLQPSAAFSENATSFIFMAVVGVILISPRIIKLVLKYK